MAERTLGYSGSKLMGDAQSLTGFPPSSGHSQSLLFCDTLAFSYCLLYLTPINDEDKDCQAQPSAAPATVKWQRNWLSPFSALCSFSRGRRDALAQTLPNTVLSTFCNIKHRGVSPTHTQKKVCQVHFMEVEPSVQLEVQSTSL